jgi:hypothetical protein
MRVKRQLNPFTWETPSCLKVVHSLSLKCIDVT